MYKTHTCGELRATNAGQTVNPGRLGPSPARPRRGHFHGLTRPLRHRPGGQSIPMHPGKPWSMWPTSARNGCLQITGTVQKRPAGMENPKMATGEIGDHRRVDGGSEPGQAPALHGQRRRRAADENTRLKYRYLDLRRERMRRNLVLRHQVVKFIRDYLDRQGFIEDRDADPVQDHAGRRARLPGAVTPVPGPVLCPAAIARSSSSSC